MDLQLDEDNPKPFRLATANKGNRDSNFLEFCRHREPEALKQSLVAEWTAMPGERRAEFALHHPKAPTPVDVVRKTKH